MNALARQYLDMGLGLFLIVGTGMLGCAFLMDRLANQHWPPTRHDVWGSSLLMVIWVEAVMLMGQVLLRMMP